MNPKISKVAEEIEKTKARIARYSTRLRNLERLKTELENAGIVAVVRGIDIPPGELEAFARAFMEQRKTAAVPDNFAPPSGDGDFENGIDDEFDMKEDIELEE